MITPENKENNILVFSGTAAICSAIILGIIFVFVSQFSSLNQENKNIKLQLEELKELSAKNNQTLEKIMYDIKK